MKKTLIFLVLVIMFMCFGLTSNVLADKSYQVRSPRGNFVTVVLTDQTLRNIRIYDLNFSNDGETFSIAAAALRPSNSSQILSINFYESSTMVQNDYVDIESNKTVQAVYCPEAFDQIVIDYDGY
jgi:hypothetical protein